MSDWADERAKRVFAHLAETIWRTHGYPGDYNQSVIEMEIAAALRKAIADVSICPPRKDTI